MKAEPQFAQCTVVEHFPRHLHIFDFSGSLTLELFARLRRDEQFESFFFVSPQERIEKHFLHGHLTPEKANLNASDKKSLVSGVLDTTQTIYRANKRRASEVNG